MCNCTCVVLPTQVATMTRTRRDVHSVTKRRKTGTSSRRTFSSTSGKWTTYSSLFWLILSTEMYEKVTRDLRLYKRSSSRVRRSCSLDMFQYHQYRLQCFLSTRQIAHKKLVCARTVKCALTINGKTCVIYDTGVLRKW